jgi:hypothetical protein
VHGLQHLPSHYLAEVDYFFNIYKDLEGKKSDTYGWEDRLVAYKIVNECVQRYHDLKAGLIDRWNNITTKGRRAKVQIKRGTGTRNGTLNSLVSPTGDWKKNPPRTAVVNEAPAANGHSGALEKRKKK